MNQPAHLRNKKPPKRLTNLRKAAKLKEAETVAEQKGLERWNNSKKGMIANLKNIAARAVDRIDPIETAAILATTVVIKRTIDSSADLLTKIKTIATVKIPLEVPATIGQFLNIPKPFQTYLELPAKVLLSKSSEVEKVKFGEEWFIWIFSFCIAYIIIKHGGSLMGMLETGLVGIITMFL